MESQVKFKPTPKMEALLQAYCLLEPDEVATNVLLGMRAGVDPTTIWRWQSKAEFEGFQDWWDGEIRTLTSARLDRIWGAMYRAGSKGDTSAARLYAERFDKDYKPTTKQEVEHKLPTLKDNGLKDRIATSRANYERLQAGGEN